MKPQTRVKTLAFLQASVYTTVKIPRGIRGRWCCVRPFPGTALSVPPAPALPAGTFADSGWNGSFHDAHWCGLLVAWGRRPGQARSRLRALFATVQQFPQPDTSIRRFEARRLVRHGD